MRTRVIILGAEKFRNGLLNVSDLESPLLIPDNGSPIFTQMVATDNEIETNFIVGTHAHLTKRLLQDKYRDNRNVKVVEISMSPIGKNGPATSLRSAMKKIPNDDLPILVFFGDNLYNLDEVLSCLQDSTLAKSSAIGFSFDFIDSPKYSSFKLTNESYITEFKPKNSVISDRTDIKTEVGLYFFRDQQKLRWVLTNIECSEMSDVLGEFQDVRTFPLKDWKDLGHWDLLSNARQIGGSRSFNNLIFDEDSGCIQKSSMNLRKITNEVEFYLQIPHEYQMHFPRFFSSNLSEGLYAIEYWPIKSLSEYIVSWKISPTKLLEAANTIANRLESYSHFHKFENDKRLDSKDLYNFYHHKLRDSLETSVDLHNGILNKENIKINGLPFAGIPALLPDFLNDLEVFSQSPIHGFLHGDMCFSNVLFSPEEGLMKFIDPRGSFIQFTNFGDIRYDISKIFQGLQGFYDFIKAGYYTLVESQDDHWDFRIFVHRDFVNAISEVEEVVLKKFPETNSSDIYRLVALNLLSLLPIHAENRNDQLAFILISIVLLNSGDTTELIEYLP